MNEINVTGYNIMRHAVQLTDTSIVEMHVIKNQIKKSEQQDQCVCQLSLSYQMSEVLVQNFDEKSRTVEVFLNMKINVFHEKSNDLKLNIDLITKGIFTLHDTELQDSEFISMVDKLCVPLLLPYVRSEVSMLAVLAGASSLSIPTLDVLGSINANKITVGIIN